jgi:hypothetical protein
VADIQLLGLARNRARELAKILGTNLAGLDLAVEARESAGLSGETKKQKRRKFQ